MFNVGSAILISPFPSCSNNVSIFSVFLISSNWRPCSIRRFFFSKWALRYFLKKCPGEAAGPVTSYPVVWTGASLDSFDVTGAEETVGGSTAGSFCFLDIIQNLRLCRSRRESCSPTVTQHHFYTGLAKLVGYLILSEELRLRGRLHLTSPRRSY